MDQADPRHLAVRQLTAYWLAHPHASDTLEGICRWWLSDASPSEPVIEQALQWLLEHGVIAAHRAADGRVRYRLVASPEAGPC